MLENVRRAVRAILDGNPAELCPKQIADRMGVHLSLLESWGDVGEYGRDIPLKRLKQITHITQDGRAVGAFCLEVLHIAIPLPEFGFVGLSDEESLHALHGFSDFTKEVSKALLDGKLTERENNEIQKKGRRAMMGIGRVMESARRQVRKVPR